MNDVRDIIQSIGKITDMFKANTFRKASLPPLHWGYKARTDAHGRRPHPYPPKPPKGRGGGSS